MLGAEVQRILPSGILFNQALLECGDQGGDDLVEITDHSEA
jgi:hypothetical protein